ncbi:DJ-1/PfpI/YhbO family deglycase/protease [Pedobacter sp. HMF7647]|uniref:DJ-1/PfpI/YhbO family deglycase/protease n=1 Tax=Hufsiella arboris TaxID=2695275 RepID=A0A7K1Y956_9SPHI|nr:type 1 glutamine amidotransferase domain-containing protein [Hufsiella arboris]MXV51122.1 DJ-1/PfpI/YhbO family deglycase/protease [Hufsiella arboris]
MANLSNRKIAILSENGFEEVELTSPKKALEEAGATVHVVSPQQDKIKAWNKTDWSIEVPVDKNLSEANANDYDGLLLPGGVINPDKLRLNEEAISFVKAFFEAGKPVAAICHGPQLLINAGVIDGRKLTSYPSIKQDLINAGANWVDQEVVVDNGFVTSRSPEDLPAFNQKIVEEFAEGVHADQHA